MYIQKLTRDYVENVVVPKSIKVKDLDHEIIPKSDYEFSFGEDLFFTDRTYNNWCNQYSNFIRNIVDLEREKYSWEKWKFIRQFFDRETAFKEYRKINYEWNREQQKEHWKKYYHKHKNDDNKKHKQKERHKQYYENNKEKINQKKKEYRENNHEKILKQAKQHRNEKKVKCDCGGHYMDVESKKSRHLKTKLHIEYVESLK